MTGRPTGAVEREYDALAAEYDRRWARYVDESVERTLAALSPGYGDRILDMGCGTGVLLARLGAAHPSLRLLGADPAPGMLRVARARLGSRAGLVRARAARIPLADGRMDAVVSSSVLHFVRAPDEALGEMHRVLRSGGRLVLTDWCRDYLLMKALDAWLRRRDPAHVRTHSAAELGALAGAAGFRVLGLERFRVGFSWGLATLVARKGEKRGTPGARDTADPPPRARDRDGGAADRPRGAGDRLRGAGDGPGGAGDGPRGAGDRDGERGDRDGGGYDRDGG